MTLLSPTTSFYALLLVCLLLAVGLSVLAWRRANRERLVVRLVAGWVAVAALWLLAYPPRRAVPSNSPAVVVLTPGYHSDSLRQLLQKLGPGATLRRYPATTPNDTPALHSLVALREQLPTLRRVHVLGRGWNADELPTTAAWQLIRHDVPPFVGFRTGQWPRQVVLGEPVVVSGLFTTPTTRQPVWLVLRAAGGGQDSMRLPTGSSAFRVRYVPKTTGRTVYELRAHQAGRILAREPVPVQVTAAPPLRVLLLTNNPGFEFNFLKNHLATRQHAVALRVQVSRGLTQTSFLNQPTHELLRLTPALLARYDVLVADHGTLAALPAGEAQTLRTAVQTQGVGLVVVADPTSLPRTLPGRPAFEVVARPAVNRPQALHWPMAPASLMATLPASVRMHKGAVALVADAQQQPVVATVRVGLGHVVVSTLPETYPWLLQNPNSTGYDAFWSRLLTAATRPTPKTAQWQMLAPWPRVDQPVTLRLESTVVANPLPTITTASKEPVRLALRQDERLPEWQYGQFWPMAAGWHRIQGPAKTDAWTYVFETNAWRGASLEAATQPVVTKSTTAGTTATTTHSQPWPASWLLILFLLAAGTLWLEEKL